ncbi:hypothetical protein [Hydrocarboniclastica marina]|uniref:hypothetical protein n=1 Tax=Hydrocarboniclastica marina TaxID=2259620 RepID=UPI0010A939A9|nr:hypothetical protein [Hydrocarboniclastica marina]
MPKRDRLLVEIALQEKLCLGSMAIASAIVGYVFANFDQLSGGRAFIAVLSASVFVAYAFIVYYWILEALEHLDA